MRWIDIGSGTGALTSVLLNAVLPADVCGIDASQDYIDYARANVRAPHVTFEAGDAVALSKPDAAYDYAVSGLALNFVSDPAHMVAEMRRVVRPGGTVALYVWDYAGDMQMVRYFWDAAVALDPNAAPLDEGRRFPLCRPDALTALFEGAALADIAIRAIDAPTFFRNFDDYWTPFLGGQGPAPGYVMSLSEEGRAALRERVRSQLPVGTDGSIDLVARAWAVRGTRV